MNAKTITSQHAQQLVIQSARLFDIRSADEYAHERITQAGLLPRSEIEKGDQLPQLSEHDTMIFTANLVTVLHKIRPCCQLQQALQLFICLKAASRLEATGIFR